ncbi:hypothetical protein [Aquimarina longa]|uniref:hypothetical protein n=1 Tax=Aquimarina longa TaxID=1080221 RepID=UPI0007804CF7|nr:hypothetical protein [Aquimarina longa]
MGVKTENIKKNYLIPIIKLLILGLFITVLVRAYNNIHFYSAINIEPNSGLLNYLKIITKTSYFRSILIFLIPFVGIFINRRIGWILITSFFFFLLSTIIFNWNYKEFFNRIDFFVCIIFTAIILLFIGIMNIKEISNLKYGIAKSELVSNNIIASIIGMSITIIMALT